MTQTTHVTHLTQTIHAIGAIKTTRMAEKNHGLLPEIDVSGNNP